jgi:two-component system, NtrC family, nitrogen regulation response regulator NtrX
MNPNKILVVDDEADIRRLLQEILHEEGFEVEVAANAQEARELRTRQLPDLVLLDIWMPDIDGITLLREWSSNPAEACPVVMMSGHGTVETAVEATRLGAFDFIEKPLSMSKLLLTVNRAMESRRPRPGGRPVVMPATAPFGRSRVVQQFRAELIRLARVNQPLLLIGEPGIEPEALARFVHQSGTRAEHNFVTISGRSMGSDQAVEALLEGTDASPGLLQQSQGGTLYIGDIEDLPDTARRLLAGLLESGSVIGRNGASTPLDARIIATAQPGAEHRIGSAAIARDLYAQLSALPLRVPALREYAEDVPELLRHTIDQMSEWEQLRFRRFTVAAQNRLRNYPWPDNLRELRNLVRRVLQRGGPEEVSLEEIERELGSQSTADISLVKQDLLALPLREAREHFERAYLTQQLQLCGGKVGQLAKRVGMERTHLYRKLRSLGIEISATTED